MAGDAQPGPSVRRGHVFLHAPSFAFQAPGGGENQLIQTGRHLEELGVPVRLFSPWTDRLETARLLHLFGMSREGLELARVAGSVGFRSCSRRSAGMSRGHWPRSNTARSENSRAWRPGACDRWPRRCRAGGASCCGWPISSCPIRAPRRTSSFVSSRFPASESVSCPTACLPSVASASPELFHSRWGAEPFVLSVGRIEPRKNTLGLIQAIRRLGLPLVVIGEAPPGCEDYERECRRAGLGRVSWLGRLDHHDPLLASAYAAARVFALPSWFETPGLAALEAGLAGCSDH